MNTLAVEKNLLKLIFLLLQIFFQFLKRYIHVIQAWSYDLVVVQKDVLPFALRFLLKLGQKKVVFEIDDAIWLPHNSIGKKGTIQKAIASYRKHCLSGVLKSSTAVITDNSFLTQYAHQYCHNVLTLTAPIDSQKYKVQHIHCSEINFIWIGSPGTSYLLEGLIPSLERLSLKTSIILHNVGGLPLKSKKFKILNQEWSIKQELESLSVADIGLMPLDNLPFNRGKWGYKMVQYFAAGIPTLASKVGLNKEAIIDFKNGILYEEK